MPTIDAGMVAAGVGESDGPVRADPSREYLVGGGMSGVTPQGGFLAAQAYDDVVRQFGPWVYELMRLDPAVYGALFLLWAGVLAEGPQVVSAIVADPGEQTMSRRRRRELRVAEEIAEYWRRQIEALGDLVFDQVLWELVDEAATGGCALAEPVYTPEPIEAGPDRGRLGLASLAVKPRSTWGMQVDPYMRVRRIRGWTAAGWRDIAREHFILLSWMPRAGDPRGTRILRPAYPAWNVKLQAVPDYAEYLKHFASPSLILTAGEYADASTTVDAAGTRTTKTPQERLLEAGQRFRNLSILALGTGDTAQVLFSQGTGGAYLAGFDWADREIFRSIILGTRPMQEAKHGSKADTDSATDLFGMAVANCRKPPQGAIRRDLFYTGTMLNWGKDLADRFTPHLSFGLSDHLSPAIMAAMTAAWASGVLQAPQRPWMLQKIGAPQDPAPDPEAPPADPEDDAEAPETPGAPPDVEDKAEGPEPADETKPPAKSKAKPKAK